MQEKDGMTPGPDDWDGLTQVLERTLRRYVPEWTNQNDADPGVTILELMAFLAEGLELRRGVVEAGRPAVGRILRALDGYAARGSAAEQFGGPTRTRFFSGRLLTAEDLSREQDYHRDKLARHLRLLHGTGIADGLTVSGRGDTVTVEPGLAIDPGGRDVWLDQPLSIAIPPDTPSPAWLVAQYTERLVNPVPGGPNGEPQPGQIEEGCRVTVGRGCDDGVVLARLERTADGWRVDSAHVPRRVRP